MSATSAGATPQQDTPATVRPVGELGPIEARSLGTALTSRLTGGTAVLLDLSATTAMDLSVLSVLVVARRRAAQEGIGLRVLGPLQPAVTSLLDDTSLRSWLQVEERV